jgi:trehalose 6-phosphate synthase
MAGRPTDWTPLGLHDDPAGPAPGNCDKLRQITQDFRQLSENACAVNAGLDAMLRAADSGGFRGATADVLREEISGRLKWYIANVAASFQVAEAAVVQYGAVLETAQQATAAALDEACGLTPDDPRVALLRGRVEGERDRLETEARQLERSLGEAADMVSQPLKVKSRLLRFLETALVVAAAVLGAVGLFTGGALAVLAWGLGVAIFIKTSIPYARGEVPLWELLLSGAGVLFPSTKGLGFSWLKGLGHAVLHGSASRLRGIGDGALGVGRRLLSPMAGERLGGQGVMVLPEVVYRVGTAAFQAGKAVGGVVGRSAAAVPGLIKTAGVLAQSTWRAGAVMVRDDFILVTAQAGNVASKVGVYTAVIGGRAFDLAVSAVLPMSYFEIRQLGYAGAFHVAVERAAHLTVMGTCAATQLGAQAGLAGLKLTEPGAGAAIPAGAVVPDGSFASAGRVLDVPSGGFGQAVDDVAGLGAVRGADTVQGAGPGLSSPSWLPEARLGGSGRTVGVPGEARTVAGTDLLAPRGTTAAGRLAEVDGELGLARTDSGLLVLAEHAVAKDAADRRHGREVAHAGSPLDGDSDVRNAALDLLDSSGRAAAAHRTGSLLDPVPVAGGPGRSGGVSGRAGTAGAPGVPGRVDAVGLDMTGRMAQARPGGFPPIGLHESVGLGGPGGPERLRALSADQAVGRCLDTDGATSASTAAPSAPSVVPVAPVSDERLVEAAVPSVPSASAVAQPPHPFPQAQAAAPSTAVPEGAVPHAAVPDAVGREGGVPGVVGLRCTSEEFAVRAGQWRDFRTVRDLDYANRFAMKERLGWYSSGLEGDLSAAYGRFAADDIFGGAYLGQGSLALRQVSEAFHNDVEAAFEAGRREAGGRPMPRDAWERRLDELRSGLPDRLARAAERERLVSGFDRHLDDAVARFAADDLFGGAYLNDAEALAGVRAAERVRVGDAVDAVWEQAAGRPAAWRAARLEAALDELRSGLPERLEEAAALQRCIRHGEREFDLAHERRGGELAGGGLLGEEAAVRSREEFAADLRTAWGKSSGPEWEAAFDALVAALPERLEHAQFREVHMERARQALDDAYRSYEDDLARGGPLNDEARQRLAGEWTRAVESALDGHWFAMPGHRDFRALAGGTGVEAPSSLSWQERFQQLTGTLPLRLEHEAALRLVLERAAADVHRIARYPESSAGRYDVRDEVFDALAADFRKDTVTEYDRLWGPQGRDTQAWLRQEAEHENAFGAALQDLQQARPPATGGGEPGASSAAPPMAAHSTADDLRDGTGSDGTGSDGTGPGLSRQQQVPMSHRTETAAVQLRQLPAPVGHPGRTATAPAAQVLIASNRGPVSFSRSEDGMLTAKRGSGGLVSGLSAIGPEAGGVWVCAALSEVDREAAWGSTRLDREVTGGQDVRMLNIDAATFADAYNGVANSTLWFVHHLLYQTPPVFDQDFRAQWTSYEAYNAAFADALSDDAAQGAAVLVQDYHLTLTPGLLRERRPDLRIGHFSHTPWAPPDYYRLLPDDIGVQVLRGILGADRAAFLTHRWARAFADCCEEVLGAKVRTAGGEFIITYEGRPTRVGVHGLGVDAKFLRERSRRPDVEERLKDLGAQIGEGRKMIVRVDRTDPSKNIVRGLIAYRRLLQTYPEWRGRVVHVAIEVPSRHDLAVYREYTAAVQRLAAEINSEFGYGTWQPLILHVKEDFAGALAAYRLADVALVNPIRDGMNLVAKEIPVVSDEGCALVLSREAGAIEDLGNDVIVINPFDIEETARSLHEALTLNTMERAVRTKRLAAAAATLTPTRWFLAQLEALVGRCHVVGEVSG